MIEVERKFFLNDSARQKLLSGAEFIEEFIIQDTYYDSPDYRLTTNNWWLRQRNDHFELKIAIRSESDVNDVTRYEEVDHEEKIRKLLKLPAIESFTDTLLKGGYKPFCSWQNTRKKYSKQGFTIDIDSVDWGHEVVEVELMVVDHSQTEQAAAKIMAFAQANDLDLKPIYGKVPEFLRRFNRAHFNELIKAKVIPDLT